MLMSFQTLQKSLLRSTVFFTAKTEASAQKSALFSGMIMMGEIMMIMIDELDQLLLILKVNP